MPQDKPTYSIKFTLKSARPDAVSDALAHLHELASESDERGEASATLTIESYHERALGEIRDAFERWLFGYDIGIECEVVTKAPGLRPEVRESLMRLKQLTPMDREGWEENKPDYRKARGALQEAATPGERAMDWLVERGK